MWIVASVQFSNISRVKPRTKFQPQREKHPSFIFLLFSKHLSAFFPFSSHTLLFFFEPGNGGYTSQTHRNRTFKLRALQRFIVWRHLISSRRGFRGLKLRTFDTKWHGNTFKEREITKPLGGAINQRVGALMWSLHRRLSTRLLFVARNWDAVSTMSCSAFLNRKVGKVSCTFHFTIEGFLHVSRNLVKQNDSFVQCFLICYLFSSLF